MRKNLKIVNIKSKSFIVEKTRSKIFNKKNC